MGNWTVQLDEKDKTTLIIYLSKPKPAKEITKRESDQS